MGLLLTKADRHADPESFPWEGETIAFWDTDGGIENAFPEIERLAADCRFADCSHAHEPGCRVLRAVAEGEIVQERLDSYHKMNRELVTIAERQHKCPDRVEKERWKEIALKVQALKKREKGVY